MLSKLATAFPPAATISSTTCWAGRWSAPSPLGLAAEVVHDDRRALGREQQRLGPADAAPGAGDDRDLAVELTHGPPSERNLTWPSDPTGAVRPGDPVRAAYAPACASRAQPQAGSLQVSRSPVQRGPPKTSTSDAPARRRRAGR